jgi:uncharacterized protein
MNGDPPRFLTAEWRHLVMLNYEVDPALFASRVPAGTELDAHEGKTYASIVGFLFLDTRVLGMPVPFHRDFEELNLRFYVRHRGPEGWRRGVVFVKELVPRRAIAWVARTVYNENYVAVPMRHAITPASVTYEWRQAARWERLAASIEGEPSLPDTGSLDEFITEHYWGYASQRDGGTVEYRVEHPQWRLWRARAPILDADLERLYGREFVQALAGPPVSAVVAEGSPVVVRQGRRLRSSSDAGRG